MVRGLITVVELPEFIRGVKGRLTDEERADCVSMLAANPECGDIMQGTGGFRKVRFATRGRGKSDSTRIVYYFHDRSVPIFLMTVFAKNEKDNLTKAERNALAAVAKILAGYGDDK